MMDHFIISPQLGIFICKNIETVRTGRNDLLYSIIIQYLYVLIGHHLEDEFVPCPARRIAITKLLLPQNSVFYPYLIQNGSKGPGDLLCPLVITAGTSHPEQYIRGFSFCRQFSHRWYLHRNYFFINVKEPLYKTQIW